MDTPSSDTIRSIAVWNSKLNIHGEFLALSCIACFSAPIGFDFLFVLAVFLIFLFKIHADSRTFPESARLLRELVRDGTADDVQRAMLKDVDAQFFSWNVAKRDVPIYCIAMAVFGLTLVALFLRALGIIHT